MHLARYAAVGIRFANGKRLSPPPHGTPGSLLSDWQRATRRSTALEKPLRNRQAPREQTLPLSDCLLSAFSAATWLQTTRRPARSGKSAGAPPCCDYMSAASQSLITPSSSTNTDYVCHSLSFAARQRSRQPSAARSVPVCVFAFRSRRPAGADRMRRSHDAVHVCRSLSSSARQCSRNPACLAGRENGS